MKVRLVAHTPAPELVVARAARTCYSHLDLGSLPFGGDPAAASRLISRLLDSGHLSPLEHAVFTFAVSDVSRVTLAQLTRHRLASYSVESQRQVPVGPSSYVEPPSLLRVPGARELFSAQVRSAIDCYRRLVELGVRREDARYCLPQAVTTSLFLTLNARELLLVASQRLCRRAQWEIRRLVHLMVREASRVAPALMARAGPPCLKEGVCPEGRFSCGRLDELRRAGAAGGPRQGGGGGDGRPEVGSGA
ncbi:MAG: FAD-dependent thymidylate synthase [Acetobacteraceae bacterium]|nr:FAD-dependent thymidylate synthase [Acetobacteraceae bacterium]